MQNTYLDSAFKQFHYYKSLGDKTLTQVPDSGLFWQPNEESNSIAIIVKHMVGNMLSRWTHFLTEDGEKVWRNRDDEFISSYHSRKDILEAWEKGWSCLFAAIESLHSNDLEQIIYIRNQGHTVTEAMNRQLCHYAYHIGQIVFIGKMILNADWDSLSIPKNASKAYNSEKFSAKKSRKHFTDDL